VSDGLSGADVCFTHPERRNIGGLLDARIEWLPSHHLHSRVRVGQEGMDSTLRRCRAKAGGGGMSAVANEEYVPYIDLPALDIHVLGEIELLGEVAGVDLVGQLADIFLADARLRLIELHQAMADADADCLARSAHYLSGASATLGATSLARLCAYLETNSRNIPSALNMRLVEAIGTEIGRVQDAFDSRVQPVLRGDRGSTDTLTVPSPDSHKSRNVQRDADVDRRRRHVDHLGIHLSDGQPQRVADCLGHAERRDPLRS